MFGKSLATFAIVAFAATICCASDPAGSNLAEKKGEMRVKAGAYYFDGWHVRTERLKTEFAHQEPVWGWEDGTQEIMEKQIDYAADYGLSFFAFDWYYPEEGKDLWGKKGGYRYDNCPLNEALGLYLKASNKKRLEFCLLVANHAPFRIGPNEWSALCKIWIDLFKDPAYLRIDGKPLLIIFNPHELLEAFGDAQGVNEAFAQLQAEAQRADIDGVEIAASMTQPAKAMVESGYTCFTGYNYRGAVGLERGAHSTYAKLVQTHEDIWERFAQESPLPYIPLVTAGWDNRSRNPEKNLQSPFFWFSAPTLQELAAHLGRAIEWLDAHADKTFDSRLLMLYSWNENAEGAYLTPTKAAGDAYLKTVSGVLK